MCHSMFYSHWPLLVTLWYQMKSSFSFEKHMPKGKKKKKPVDTALYVKF